MQNMSINVGGRLLDLSQPRVVGILNATPDSFYAGSRQQTEADIARRANEIVEQGGDIIDVGAYSTRPGAELVDEDEEMERLKNALDIVRRQQPDALISVDTFRPDVARMAVEEFGVGLVNDVSEGHIHGAFGGTQQPDEVKGCPPMFQMVAKLRVPYILMSVLGTMEQMLLSFAREVQLLRSLGQKDIILDPGFGFGKTLEENYTVMQQMEHLHTLGLPLLVGVSRKSMIWKLLGSSPDEALNGTTVLNTLALQKGARLLRVHDVREAVETIRIYQAVQK
ncbi:MAG: dihydropteroate synthase [Prevotella sp.]|nr:dihydropteroate synthase [Prevotella sp.]